MNRLSLLSAAVLCAVAIGTGSAQTPAPLTPASKRTPAGTVAEHFTFDSFRVRNGKLVEHWDGATLPPVTTVARNEPELGRAGEGPCEDQGPTGA
jgi:hypothetical protein